MKREWKPGDVAMVLLADEWHRAMRTGLPGNMGWELESPTSKRWCSDDALDLRDDEIRPVAVIDFEDREQVERLIRLQDKHFNDGIREVVNAVDLHDMQAALREYADPKPPRPEEPTGLGAVVEDDEGVRWVRRSTHPARSWSADTGSFQRAADYADIDAVRVLSEGVTE